MTITEGEIVMSIKLNKKRFLKFMFIVATLITGAVMENGDITGAIVLAMLI